MYQTFPESRQTEKNRPPPPHKRLIKIITIIIIINIAVPFLTNFSYSKTIPPANRRCGGGNEIKSKCADN